MASKGTKEYVIKINGIEKSLKDVTTLEAAVTALDAALIKAQDAAKKEADSTTKSTKANKDKAKALTDEEKAAAKLATTQKRLADLETEANREQIKANIELRQRTHELTRQIAAEQLAEGSIKAMGMQLTDLRNEYEALTAAEREEQAVGGALLDQIQALDAEYKALRESTGNFRDSVGNYKSALSGLNELKDRFELAARGSTELAANVVGTNDALDVLGGATSQVAKSSEQLAGIVALATTAQEAYNAILKENFIQSKAAAVMDAIRTVQIKAKAAAEAQATKGTIAATVAQKAFNLVASANPYVLLALALASVVGAIALFVSKTEDAAEKQSELNAVQAIYLDQLDAEAAKLKETGDARVTALEGQLKVLNAAGAKTADIRKKEDELAAARAANNARQRGYYAQEIKDLDKNRDKLDKLREVFDKIKQAQARGEDKIRIDVDLDGKIEKVKVEDAIKAVQSSIDLTGRRVKVAVDLVTEQTTLAVDQNVSTADRGKQDREKAKENAEKAASDAKERREAELNAVRAAEDTRIKIIDDSYARQRATINAEYDRQIEDLRRTLATEKKLTATARQAINENIISIAQQRNKDLDALERERADKVIQDTRAMEDARTALIIGSEDRRRAEINASYGRQIEDLQKRLDTEKDLTDAQTDAITDIIVSKQIARDRELESLAAQGAQLRAQQELTALDIVLEQANSKIGDLTKRKTGALRLIDVEETRKNLKAANGAIDEYIASLRVYEKSLTDAHDLMLSSLERNTPEYVDEVNKYAAAQENVTKRIKAAQDEQKQNTRDYKDVQVEYYRELFSKIAEYAQAGADAIGMATETYAMAIEMQIEDLEKSLESISEKYDIAKAQREQAVEDTEELEERLRSATGGTADAIKEQLADSMRARNDAMRQEKQLQKEKEKAEAEIQKKQKQMRRAELVSSMAMAVANTAQGVTKGLSMGFPLGIIFAAIIGALGLVQIGLMARQLSKLEKGGPIVGPSHRDGGVNIGMGYEAEGGEYVINKKSYAANPRLVEYINASNGVVSPSELAGVLPNEGAPTLVSDSARSSEDRVVEAINNINLRPVVSVVDIIDATDEVVTVRDIAGF